MGMVTLDANEAVASVAYRINEVIVLYPITLSSPMGESCDEWSAHRRRNLWDTIPDVTEMQSEGAIGPSMGHCRRVVWSRRLPRRKAFC